MCFFILACIIVMCHTHTHTHTHTLTCTHTGFEFPSDFISVVKKLFRTYFAILAHIYYHHFDSMLRLSLHEGLNTLFLHLMYFVQEFSLLEPKDYQCMDELIVKLIEIDREYAKNPPVDAMGGLSLSGGRHSRANNSASSTSDTKTKSNSYIDHTS